MNERKKAKLLSLFEKSWQCRDIYYINNNSHKKIVMIKAKKLKKANTIPRGACNERSQGLLLNCVATIFVKK